MGIEMGIEMGIDFAYKKRGEFCSFEGKNGVSFGVLIHKNC